jgi:hypothetical protein
MRIDDKDTAHRAAVMEPGSPLESRELPSGATSHGLGWMRAYGRLAGCIQLLYAVVVGRLAYLGLSGLVHDIVHHGEMIGKGGGPISLHAGDLLAVTIVSLLCLTSFIGGCGLVGLRPWARRWEVAYLGVGGLVVAVTMVAMLSGAVRMPRDFDDLTMFALIAVAFALPYLPFLVTSWWSGI